MGEMVKRSIVMTVKDRLPEIILPVMAYLKRAIEIYEHPAKPDGTLDLNESNRRLNEGYEVVIVSDQSQGDYTYLKEWAKHTFKHFVWKDLEPYERFELLPGYGNPSRAFNECLRIARGEDIFIMSSDVIVTPKAIEHAFTWDLSKAFYTPLIVDMESGNQYCGPMRVFPMPWFIGAKREDCLYVGGWDEEYLKGISFEDNDFIGRLLLKVGAFYGDWHAAAYHMAHYQPAYDPAVEGLPEAFQTNRIHTIEKWKGLPFWKDMPVFEIKPKIQENGDVLCVLGPNDCDLADLIRKTRGILARNPEGLVETQGLG